MNDNKISLLNYYKALLLKDGMPSFLSDYLEVPSILRLKKIGYFCGMDYASKSIYNFSEYISRYDHSLTVALLTYKLTKDREKTLSALFHDIATPCFAHVIDYMNKDYEKQESTELFQEKIVRSDKKLIDLLNRDNVNIENIINFKNFTIVDNERPKVCADRLDGVVLTSIGWTKTINKEDIESLVDSIILVKNEYSEEEIGFKNRKIVDDLIKNSIKIDKFCHTNEDNYMMELLAEITRSAINSKIFSYDDLYIKTEEEIFIKLDGSFNDNLKEKLNMFRNIKLEEVPQIYLPSVKVRKICPILDGERVEMINNSDINDKNL